MISDQVFRINYLTTSIHREMDCTKYNISDIEFPTSEWYMRLNTAELDYNDNDLDN